MVGFFPSRDAIIRLVGAVLTEQNYKWTESRRYMGPEILAACHQTGIAAIGLLRYDGTPLGMLISTK